MTLMTFKNWADMFRVLVQSHEDCQGGCTYEQELGDQLTDYYRWRRNQDGGLMVTEDPLNRLSNLMKKVVEAEVADERKRIRKIIGDLCDKDCKCGGAGPGEGCDVCNFYHRLMDRLV